MATMTITQSLIDAGIKYRKELLAAPVAELAPILPFFTMKTGVQGEVVGGWLATPAELRPYKTTKGESGSLTVTPESMFSYLGDVVKEFDPHEVLGTLYTELTSLGVTQMQISKRIALEIARKVGEALHDNLFIADRNASGTATVDLFNGFETLLADAVLASTISEAKGNYMDLTGDTLTEANAGDILKNAWRNLDRNLKKQRVLLYIPETVMDFYEDWYQNEYSTQPWNTGIEQKFLVGSRGQCQLVPMNPMSGNYAIFSVKENMNILVDQTSDHENVRIRECDNPKLVQFFMKAYFGTGFETLQKEFLCAAKISLSE